MTYKNVSDLTLDDLNGDSLEHYGIPGQKWGVRRYQNEDGTLTAAGKKRYGEEGPTMGTRSSKRYAKDVTKALNKLDQNRAENEFQVNRLKSMFVDPLTKRAQKREARGKDVTKLVSKRDKRDARIENGPYTKGLKESKKLIEHYLSVAKKMGYEIDEKPMSRVVYSSPNAAILGGAVAAAMTMKYGDGTLYKVRAPKED